MKKNERIINSYDKIDELDNENLNHYYTASQIYESLGMHRETLRYYEKLGLLKPDKAENNYRLFTALDFQRLMMIDAFKKRGFKAVKAVFCIIKGYFTYPSFII